MKNTATPTPPTTPADEFTSPLAPPVETTPDWFPELTTLSPAFLFRMIPVPDVEPTPPEYVFLPEPSRRNALGFDLATASWNSLWEAGPFAADIVHLLVQRDLRPHLPADFDERLAKAFSRHMWPLLNGRGGQIAFSKDEPIKVLSHHLDYWLPYIDVVAQRRMRLKGRCEPNRDDV